MTEPGPDDSSAPDDSSVPGGSSDATGGAAQRSLPAHFREKSPLTDTAGVPWAGRDYTLSPFPEDDGSTPPALADALAVHRRGEDPHRCALVEVLATSRVLVPIMAVATELGATAHGLTGDNGADMAMVSITAPDGSRVLPLFTSVTALSTWRGDARPVPVVAPQAAQAAVKEGCTALLLDPDTPTEQGGPILLPRSVLWALAQGRTWIPPHEDPELISVLDQVAAAVGPVTSLVARPGQRSEVDLHLGLVPGLSAEQVQAVVQEISAHLGAEPLVAERISSLRLALEG